MRIHVRPNVILICTVSIILTISIWYFWQRYTLVINHFSYATPKTDLNELEQAVLSNSNSISICQYYAQGKLALAVDSKGYICERRHLEKTNGCCQTTFSSSIGPYVCDTCASQTNCCSIFEHCLSCCLKPDNVDHLQNYIRSNDFKIRLLLSHVTTSFDICLLKCRTHSNSVIHENEYIDSKHKYCFS